MPDLVGNRFECVEEIGRGADSIVYRGIDRETGAPVAVKTLTCDPSSGAADLEREINARQHCESEHILPIIAWGLIETGEVCRQYVVTPYIEGETLEARLKRGTLSESEAAGLADEIASALQPIHESGILHSDLKPANIFFTDDGKLKLLDFGLARLVRQVGVSGGTAGYAAPEQLLGHECEGGADLYSLGCILYETVTGSPPFVSDDIAEVLFDQVNTPPIPPNRTRTDLSPFLNAVILALLAKVPEERFHSALELRQTLREGESGAWWQHRIASVSDREEELHCGWEPSRPWQTPLVGRLTELDRISRMVSGSIERKAGCFVAIGGAAGIGKTRLVEECMSGFRREALICTSRCIKFDTRVPYLPLIGLIDNLVQREKFDSSRFRRFLNRHLSQTPMLVPKFMEFLSKQAMVESGPGALTTDNLLYLFTALFQNLASESPVILFIDDLHWAEPSTCNFLRYFVRNITDVPLILLSCYRPEEFIETGETESPAAVMLRDLGTDPNFETIILNPLSARESQELVRVACGESVETELGNLLYKRTEGNPYYMFESIALLREREVIRGDRTDSRVPTSVTEISIPTTVADLLKSRLARLSDSDRELIEYASIQGPVFRSDLLVHPDDTDQLTLLRRLARIEREHRIIRSRESGYGFDHHLLYEYVYNSISPDLRAAYHRQVAERLEESIREVGEDTVYTLADHYSRGAEDSKASDFLMRAARLSMAKYSGAEALETLGRAREHFGKLPEAQRTPEREWEFELLQAEIAAHLGDNAVEGDAVEQLSRLAESFGTPDKLLDARERKADYSLRISRFDDALEGFDAAREIANNLNDTKRLAQIAHKLGATHREMLKWDEAMHHFREALDLAKTAEDSHLVGCVLKDIATVKTKQSKWSEAISDYNAALPLLREADDRREEAFALNGLAVSFFCSGERDAALDRWEEANRIFESIGYPSGQSNILHNLGVTYSNLGQMDRAIECLRSAVRLRQSIGMRHAEVYSQTRLGFVYFVIGAFEQAAEQLRSALTVSREIGADLVCIEIYYHFTELAIAQNDPDSAAEHVARAWTTLGKNTDPHLVAHLKMAQGIIALARGEWSEAAKHFREAADEDVQDRHLKAEIFIHSAWAAQAEGRIEDADRFIEIYRENAEGCPFIYARIMCLIVMQTIYRLRGDKNELAEIAGRLGKELAAMDEGMRDPELRKAFMERWGKYIKQPSGAV